MTNWNNKEEVLAAVKQNGADLKFASERLRDDEEVVLEAMRENRHAAVYASERVQKSL